MDFQPVGTEFDGVTSGEAPQLSITYGQYDNGANVFTAYFNGNTATSDFSVYTGLTVVQSTGVAGPGGTTINAIQIYGATGAHITAFVFNTAMSNVGLITESSFAFAADTADATGITGLVNSATASGVTNGISVGMGYTSDYFFQAYDLASAVTLPSNQQGAVPAAGTWVYGSTTYTGTSATSWTAYDAPQLYSTTGGYTSTVTNNPLSGATNVYLGAISGSSAVSIYYNWERARAYPPNGVMPSASPGSISQSNPPKAGVSLSVQNFGVNPLSLSAVYVQNEITGTLVASLQLSSPISIQPGAFQAIAIDFTPINAVPYKITVVTLLGTQVSTVAIG